MSYHRFFPLALLGLAALSGVSRPTQGQGPVPPDGDPETLAGLVREALERSPALRAARFDAEGDDARARRAGAWDDPQLFLGFRNLPVSSLSADRDPMTQRVVQIGQKIPLSGGPGARKRIERERARATRHAVDGTRIEVATRVKERYAELHFLEHALRVTDENLQLLSSLEEATRTAYVTGTAEQPDLLRAGVEIEELRGRRLELSARREEALARLNELRDRPPGTPVSATAFPAGLLEILEARPSSGRFAASLRIRSDFPVPGLPPGDSLVALALDANPGLAAHLRRVRARDAAVDLARTQRWPEPTLSLGFGQRDVRENLLSLGVSFRLPVFAGARQGAAVEEQRARRTAADARYLRAADAVERRVVAAHAHLRHAYGQSNLVRSGVLARAEATFEATLAAYRSGTQDFPALLDSQSLVYRYELEYHRRMADFLVAWAELERAVGKELTP